METKPGYKTSEFWLTLAAQVVGALFASGIVGEASPIGKALALAAMLLGALGYTVVRGGVKKVTAAAAAHSAKKLEAPANPTSPE